MILLLSIPREVGHITQIAVLNLAGNRIPHLPLSFVKLKRISAIWLTENQTKPLVQLNPDVDQRNRNITNAIYCILNGSTRVQSQNKLQELRIYLSPAIGIDNNVH